MNIKQFIEFLQTLPQDATVKGVHEMRRTDSSGQMYLQLGVMDK